ncbi:helix-turn-helix domain-containing protein [Mumia zhuanghuii]|uniref:Helix-turn-helix domain-containing protein n=2 Tax=Mumia TaxID=1546255 RepID=A0ABW1QJF3_9ACTN|nr:MULTISPECIES: helix-turn-helix domain-containing protein [Mumia]KAA1419901.1 helix-turn-helix domain-containing protein [Mumia zhuanghuii]
MTTDPNHVVLDSSTLKALAHPLRVALLGALRRHGPSTATLLGQRLDISSGSASYHLRQLEKAGLVTDDAGRGNARDRWWRAAHRMTEMDDRDFGDGDAEVVDEYLRSIASAYTRQLEQTVNARATMQPDWRHVMDLSDYLLRVTPDEARTLAMRLHAVVREFRYDRPGNPAPAGAEPVSVVLQILPQPVDEDPS